MQDFEYVVKSSLLPTESMSVKATLDFRFNSSYTHLYPGCPRKMMQGMVG